MRELDDTEVLELAIIENIQRADLNAGRGGAGYRQLMDRFGHTQERLAEALGKSRSHIANLLRLLDPARAGARAPARRQADAPATPGRSSPPPTPRRWPARWSSATCRCGRPRRWRAAPPPGPPAPARRPPAKDADTRALEEDLTASLRLKVSIDHRPGGQAGELRIRYATLEELDGLCQLLSR